MEEITGHPSHSGSIGPTLVSSKSNGNVNEEDLHMKRLLGSIFLASTQVHCPRERVKSTGNALLI